MRALVWVVVAVCALWGGFWVVGSTALQRAADGWFADAAAAGITARREKLVVRGFPNRFDLTVTGLQLGDPATGWGWDAPFAQVFSMTWKPWHLIAALPPSQVIRTPQGQVVLTSDRLMGSLVLHPGVDLGLDRVVVQGDGLVAAAEAGWRIGLDRLLFSTAHDASRRFAHRIGLEIAGLEIDGLEKVGLAADPPGQPDVAGQPILPGNTGKIALIRLDAHALLTAALDRHAGRNPPVLTGIELDALRLEWDAVTLTANGSLAVASEGFAEGRIDIRAENWRDLPALLVAAGLIKPELQATVTRALTLMAAGNDRVLSVPLTFKAGRMALGMLPIGRAPKLR